MPMTAFDPLKAAREELAGLADVHRTLVARESCAQEDLSKAENELNVVRKITGYVRIAMDQVRRQIEDLERKQ